MSSLASRARLTILDNFTANRAASSKLSTGRIFNPEDAINTFASSTLVPCNLQTIGILKLNSFAAAIIPSAMTSHLMIPPKIFTRMAWTLGSAVIILNASLTADAVAPPPTSRKLAGEPP